MTRVSHLWWCFLILTGGCAGHRAVPGTTAPESPDDFGVLLMAHGGSPEWNNAILATVKPLRDEWKLEVAFGMADPATIQEGVSRLEARGVRSIGVVRLFVSGASWYDRTEQILGLQAGAAALPVASSDAHASGRGDHDSSMGLRRIQTGASFALSAQGLVEAPEMGTVLADRARSLSRDPQREDVLILSHGTGDDPEQERLLASLDARADAVRGSLDFRRVQVDALREDWPEKRKEARSRIRAFVMRSRDDGVTAIVIPFRVQGFGPYAEVLDGLHYVSDGQGLVPHPNVTEWVAGQIKAVRQGPFRSPAK